MWHSKLIVSCFVVLFFSFAHTLPTEKKAEDKEPLLKLEESVKASSEAPVSPSISANAESTVSPASADKPQKEEDKDQDDAKPAEIKPLESSSSSSSPFSPSSPNFWYPDASDSDSTDHKPSDWKPSTTQAPPSESLPPSRRQIQYDQRQDGKYNIRADLENFVILVVPSTGNSLLDLLRRSSASRHQPQYKRIHGNKHHKKYFASADKMEGSLAKKNQHRLDYLRPEIVESGEVHPHAGAFVEGRTPYHVDISSSEILQPAVTVPVETNQPQHHGSKIAEFRTKITNQVLRSLVQPSSIAEIPLEIEPMVAEAAQEAAVLVPVIKGKLNARHAKSLTNDGHGHNNIITNSVILTPNRSENKHDEFRNAGVGVGESDPNLILNAEYINLSDTNDSFDSLNADNIHQLALAGDTKTNSNNQWELTLLGAQEQCGPDRRRDSYGICQFVPPDYASS